MCSLAENNSCPLVTWNVTVFGGRGSFFVLGFWPWCFVPRLDCTFIMRLWVCMGCIGIHGASTFWSTKEQIVVTFLLFLNWHQQFLVLDSYRSQPHWYQFVSGELYIASIYSNSWFQSARSVSGMDVDCSCQGILWLWSLLDFLFCEAKVLLYLSIRHINCFMTIS